MKEKVKIFALGGLDEHGKNMYVVEINDDIFVFDCGLKYPTNKIPGVDSLIPNFDYLKENKDRVKGYFISHFHDDKMGALPYIYREVPAPVITAPFTAQLIDIYTKRLGLDVKYKYELVKDIGTMMIAGHKFHFSKMTHSAPYSLSCSIYTEHGYIAYTSDYVVDFNPLPNSFKMSIESISELSQQPVLALLSDSTNADRPGHTSPRYMLTPHVQEQFENSNGRIYCALYGQNMMNILELYTLAAKTNKTIVCYKKEVEKMFLDLYNTYGAKMPVKPKMESMENINRLRDKDVLVLLINDGSNLYNDIIEFCLHGFNNKPIEFKEDDVFIFDCPSVAATEILATEALDATYQTGCQVINLGRKEKKTWSKKEK